MVKHMKSPFWSILSIVTIALMLVTKLEVQNMPNWLLYVANGALIGSILFLVVWILSMIIHNRKHPTEKVNWTGLYPVEFREEDEGMQWLTYRACRKVYRFFYVSLPIVLIVLFLFPEQRSLPILLIMMLAISQYLIYWSVVRKANLKEEE